jgi:hypothetical protein
VCGLRFRPSVSRNFSDLMSIRCRLNREIRVSKPFHADDVPPLFLWPSWKSVQRRDHIMQQPEHMPCVPVSTSIRRGEHGRDPIRDAAGGVGGVWWEDESVSAVSG